MDLLNEISRKIELQSNISWIDVALSTGIDINDVDNIKKKNNTAIGFVLAVTNKIWQDILLYTNISLDCAKNVAEISNVIKVGKILSGDIVRDKEEKPQFDILKEIACRISEWKILGRLLNLKEFDFSQIENEEQLIEHRNLRIMKKFSYPFPPSNSWKFWCGYLNQFDEGKRVISEMEITFVDLMNEVSSSRAHMFSSGNFTYFGHPFELQEESLHRISECNKRIAVPVGSKEFQFVDYQELSEWVQTQKRYIDTYDMLKDLKVMNFVDGSEFCPVLNTLKHYLESVDDIGFAAKGYHFTNHICLFKGGMFAKTLFDDHYFCLFAKDNVVLYLTKQVTSANRALHHSLQNIEIANLLHKDLRDFVQINVIIHATQTVSEFCKVCVDNSLYVEEDVFTDIQKFSSWYESTIENLNVKAKGTLVKNVSEQVLENVIENVRKDMITYEALESSSLPSFSNCSDDQMDELKKVVLLTPTQYNVLHSKEKHILLKGSYGSGKSLVLLKKFEAILNQVGERDVFYLICNDQQSEFAHYMKHYKSLYPKKLLIPCNSSEIIPQKHVPKLSSVLRHISEIWKGKHVHVFIDELNTSFFDKGEIQQVKSLMNFFSNSYVVISLQSMEEHLCTSILSQSDIGFHCDELVASTSFTCFYLDNAMRCSKEINEFVKATSQIFESSSVKIPEGEHFYVVDDLIVDKEHGREFHCSNQECTNVICYKYNQSDSSGHSVSGGPVNIYFYEEKNSHKDKRSFKFYLEAMKNILEDASPSNKYVVCTFEDKLLVMAYSYLSGIYKEDEWTLSISKFMGPDSSFSVLLTNHASVRGFEFPNLIFMLPMGTKFLKYRMIECFTRATTKLFLVTHAISYKKSNMAKYFSKLSTRNHIDDRLIKCWKALECVKFSNFTFSHDKDEQIDLAVDQRFITTNSIPGYSVHKFANPVKLEEEEPTSRDPLSIGMKLIISFDDINLFVELVNVNEIDVNKYNCETFSYSLLHIAFAKNAVTIARWLLNNPDVDVNCVNCVGDTILHLAAREGSLEFVKLLTENKLVDLNAKNGNGYSPLHIAIDYEQINVVKHLIKIRETVDLTDHYGNTPLDMAVACGNNIIIQLLESVSK